MNASTQIIVAGDDLKQSKFIETALPVPPDQGHILSLAEQRGATNRAREAIRDLGVARDPAPFAAFSQLPLCG
jgi:hypothetical protein